MGTKTPTQQSYRLKHTKLREPNEKQWHQGSVPDGAMCFLLVKGIHHRTSTIWPMLFDHLEVLHHVQVPKPG